MKVVDLTGEKFGLLTVVEKLPEKDANGKTQYRCYCDCDKKRQHPLTIRGTNLTTGRSKSCGCIRSKGEYNITQVLLNNNITFSKEYTFPGLEEKAPLRFDFATFDENNHLIALIEFDGEQHHNGAMCGWRGMTPEIYAGMVRRDKMKDEYCKKNDISLIRIPYKERDNINLEMLQPETTAYLI